VSIVRFVLSLVFATAFVGCDAGQGEEGSVGTDGTVDLDASISDTGAAGDTSEAIDTMPADTAAFEDTAVTDTGATDSATIDATSSDTGSVTDTKPTDTGADVDTWTGTAHVHVYISNTCDVSTSPTSFDVPAGKTLKLSWHNHSVDYRADLWGSYGGGYLMLDKGATWNEPYEHCFIKSTHTEYMDVSPEGSPPSCGKFRVNISCHAP
jgi:hypothetical protein